jgi:hypothetical protein
VHINLTSVEKERCLTVLNRSYLKKVFWPPAFGGIGASLKILEMRKYACGFKLGPAAHLNQNPVFETASGERERKDSKQGPGPTIWNKPSVAC